MVKGINHIGIAVESIDETFATWQKAFGAVMHGRDSAPEIGQNAALVSIGDTYFELMEPCGENGPIPKFIAKKGEGVHHISIWCGDLDEDVKTFEEAGLTLLGRDDKGGFLSPKGNHGILCEITNGYDPRKEI